MNETKMPPHIMRHREHRMNTSREDEGHTRRVVELEMIEIMFL